MLLFYIPDRLNVFLGAAAAEILDMTDLCGIAQVNNGTLCLIRRGREESARPTDTEENNSGSTPTHASLSESSETEADRASSCLELPMWEVKYM